jgi:hypothetical protein
MLNCIFSLSAYITEKTVCHKYKCQSGRSLHSPWKVMSPWYFPVLTPGTLCGIDLLYKIPWRVISCDQSQGALREVSSIIPHLDMRFIFRSMIPRTAGVTFPLLRRPHVILLSISRVMAVCSDVMLGRQNITGLSSYFDCWAISHLILYDIKL